MPAYPHILVVGTTFAVTLPWYRPFRRLADMVGRELARSRFGLITGSTPGVDKLAARAFWAECLRNGQAPEAGAGVVGQRDQGVDVLAGGEVTGGFHRSGNP
mgnify:CR=1 FL=1